MPETGENTVLEVAGRTFRPVTPSTLEHYQYVALKLVAAGATDGGPIPEIAARIAEHGYGPELLAGFYVEVSPEGEPVKWTPKYARSLAAAFRQATDVADWSAMTLGLMRGLKRFFFGAPDSSAPSPTASTTAAPGSDGPVTNPEPAPSGSPS